MRHITSLRSMYRKEEFLFAGIVDKIGTHMLNFGSGCAKRSPSATMVTNRTIAGEKLEWKRKVSH